MFRKELLWWRDINTGVADMQLCATLAIKSDGAMKTMLVKFMEESRIDSAHRTMPKLIAYLDEELAKTAQEQSICKISLRSSFQKKPMESLRGFWLRWEKLQSALARSGVTFPDTVNYYRALDALHLHQPQLGILIGSLEARQSGISIPELKRATVKMFETTFLENSAEILNVDGSVQDGSQCDKEDGADDAYTTVEEFGGSDGEIYELRKITPKNTETNLGMLYRRGGMPDIRTS